MPQWNSFSRPNPNTSISTTYPIPIPPPSHSSHRIRQSKGYILYYIYTYLFLCSSGVCPHFSPAQKPSCLKLPHTTPFPNIMRTFHFFLLWHKNIPIPHPPSNLCNPIPHILKITSNIHPPYHVPLHPLRSLTLSLFTLLQYYILKCYTTFDI